MSDQKDPAVVTATAMTVAERELPEPVRRRGIQEAQWLTLCNNLFPGVDPKSVLMVWDYCASRKLDPMKKPCHIVPMNFKDARSGEWVWRDVVMPGIYEFRTTAHRTGEYLGHSKPEYGPTIEYMGVSAPEWCDLTVYRLVKGTKVEFPVRCYFREVVVLKKPKRGEEGKTVVVNERWTRAPIQMMTKCTEAAGLREAFPEELGGEHTDDEMSGRIIEVQTLPSTGPSRAPILDVFDKLPETVRDAIERAFAALNLSEAQRLVRLNEFLGGDADLELGSAELLKWCHTASTRQVSKGPANGKGDAKAKDPSVQSVAGAGSGSADVAQPSTAGDSVPPKDGASVSKSPQVASQPITAAEVFGEKSLGF